MFDYLGVLISVILGLGLTHLLLGLSRTIQARHTVRIYWVHIVWTFSMLVYVLAIWWGMYWWRQLHEWTIQFFMFLAGYSAVLFLLASLLFPHELRDGLDFEAEFMRNRRWFFGLLIVALALDIPETALKGVDHLRAVPAQYILFLPSALLLAAAGWLTANRRAHGLIAISWLAALLGYLTLSSLQRVVVH